MPTMRESCGQIQMVWSTMGGSDTEYIQIREFKKYTNFCKQRSISAMHIYLASSYFRKSHNVIAKKHI